MGAISMGLPAIYVPAGLALRGNWRGATLGSATRENSATIRENRHSNES
jgi:hypothetical protein